MKNVFRILSCLLIAATTCIALAQTKFTISQALDYWISNCEKDVVSAADAMPEAKYSFTPTAGEFAGARTFAEQIKHLAANNYRMAARMLGQKPTPDQEAETGPDAVRSKAEILDYLKGSFAALHRSATTRYMRIEVVAVDQQIEKTVNFKIVLDPLAFPRLPVI